MQTMFGNCLCKAIKYEVTPPILSAAHCHCESCRRANSSAFVSWANVGSDQLLVTSGKRYLKGYESSPGASRMFCNTCGSHLLMRYTTEPETIYFTFGSLVSLPDKNPDKHFSFEEHVSWFSLNDLLPRYIEKTRIDFGPESRPLK